MLCTLLTLQESVRCPSEYSTLHHLLLHQLSASLWSAYSTYLPREVFSGDSFSPHYSRKRSCNAGILCRLHSNKRAYLFMPHHSMLTVTCTSPLVELQTAGPPTGKRKVANVLVHRACIMPEPVICRHSDAALYAGKPSGTARSHIQWYASLASTHTENMTCYLCGPAVLAIATRDKWCRHAAWSTGCFKKRSYFATVVTTGVLRGVTPATHGPHTLVAIPLLHAGD